MSQNPPRIPGGALHIRSDTHAGGDVDELLLDYFDEVHHAPDVYRGLALLLTRARPRLVVVCLNGLSSAEMEFFKHAARRREPMDLWVHSGDFTTRLVEEAIHAGASGLITRQRLDDMLEYAIHRPMDACAAVSQTQATPSRERDESSTLTVHPREIDEEIAEPQPIHQDDQRRHDQEDVQTDQAPVRVPWLRRAGTPSRTAPGQSSGVRSASREPRRLDPLVGRNAPLLTEQELRALLDDDVKGASHADTQSPARTDESEAKP